LKQPQDTIISVEADQTSALRTVGILHSPYKEKFAVPRQPGLVTAARAELHLLGDCNREEILRGIEDFSHLWLLFIFHRVAAQGWKPTVRPPRLGGNKRLGVFATRSPFRPNPIGLSVVRNEGIENRDGQWLLHLSGADLVDGTPVVDIKPYVPYADAIADPSGGFTDTVAFDTVDVHFSEASRRQLDSLATGYPQLEQLIIQVLAQQPQPAYSVEQDNQQNSQRIYGMTLFDLNIRWRHGENRQEVVAIEQICRE